MLTDHTSLQIAADELRACRATVGDRRADHGRAAVRIQEARHDVDEAERRVSTVKSGIHLLPMRDGRETQARSAKSFRDVETDLQRAYQYLIENFETHPDRNAARLVPDIAPIARLCSFKSYSLRIDAILGAYEAKIVDVARLGGNSIASFRWVINEAIVQAAEAQRIAVHVGDRAAVDPSAGLPRLMLQTPIASTIGEVDASAHRLAIALMMHCDRLSPGSEAEISLRALCELMGGIRPARLAVAIEKLRPLTIKGEPLFGGLEIRGTASYLVFSISSSFATRALKHRANRAVFPLDITVLNGLTSAAQRLLLIAISTDAIAGEHTRWRISPADLAECLGIPMTIATRSETVRRLIEGLSSVTGWRFSFEANRDHRRRGAPISTIDIAIVRTKVLIGSGLRAAANPQFVPDQRVAGRSYDCSIPSILEGKPADWNWRRRGDEISPRTLPKVTKPAILEPSAKAPAVPAKSYINVTVDGLPAIRVWRDMVSIQGRTAVKFTPDASDDTSRVLSAIDALCHAASSDRERDTLLDLRLHILADPESILAA